MEIQSDRLEIIACDQIMIDLVLSNRQKLAEKLQVAIPHHWPVSPEALPVFNELLQADESLVGWLNYFAIHRKDRVMIGDCGFLGKPDDNQTVEIGYSVLPEYRQKGYATEMTRALVEWAFSTGKVRRVIAHTLMDNEPSLGVLKKLNFILVEENIETDEGLKCRWGINKTS